MKKWLVALIAAISFSLEAEAGYIVQSGNVTPGHVGMWATDGVLMDAGPATAGAATEFGVTKNGGKAICVNSGPISGPYQELCIGATTNGGATLDLEALGGAPSEPLNIVVDGNTVLSLSGSTTGLVTVTGTPTSGHCATWTGASSIGDAGAACGSGGSISIPNDTMLGNISGVTAPAAAMTPEQINTLMSTLDNVIAEGADPTGAADSTTPINTALATCAAYLPPGTYKVAGNLTTGSCTNTTIVGAGSALVTLKATGTNNVLLNNAATNGLIQGITFDRSGSPATSGAIGLSMAGVTNQFTLYDLKARNQYNGFLLGPSAWSFASGLEADSNFNAGFLMTNLFFSGSMQWNFQNSIAQFNNGWGVQVTTNFTGPSYLLPWYNISTFANSGGGIQVAGSTGKAIENFQLVNGILNGDGNDSIQISSYGQLPILISSTQMGSEGVIATGRAQATAASHVGNGINVTGQNDKLSLVQNVIEGASKDGIAIQSGALNFLEANANISELNGQSTPGATYHGLSIGTTLTGLITGGSYANRTGATTQAYGIGALNGTGLTFQGVDVSSNNVGGIVIGSNANLAFCSGIQGESMTLIGCNQGGGGGGGITSISQSTNITATPNPITGTGTIAVVNNPTFSGLITANAGIAFGSGQQACWLTICDGAALGARQLGIGSTQVLAESALNPVNDNTLTLGTNALRWSDFHVNTATFSGNITTGITGTAQCLQVNSSGVISGTGAVCGGSGSTPGGSSGQIQYNNGGVFGGFTMSGDCTITVGVIVCTKSNGTAFGTAAFDNTGTSGANIPLLNGTNTWSGVNTFNANIALGAADQLCWSTICDGANLGARQLGINATQLLAEAPLNPVNDNTISLGTNLLRYSDVRTVTETLSGNLTTNITGSTQCVQANSSGVLSGTGSACGSGGAVSSVTGSGAVSASPTTGAVTVSMASASDATVLANISGGSAAPTMQSLAGIGGVLDHDLGSTVGGIAERTVGGWSQLAPGSQGAILYAHPAPTWLAPGTAGQVLTSNGASADPSWTSAGSGTVTSIAAGTNLSASPSSPITGSGTLNVVSNPTFSGTITANGSPGLALPNNGNIDLGATAVLSGNGSTVTLTGAALKFATGMTIEPNADNTYDLGTSSLEWANAWIAGGGALNFGGATNAQVSSSGSTTLLLKGSFSVGVNTPTLGPTTDNATHLGNTGDRWIDVWAVNGTIQTSDRRDKTNIQPDDLGLAFINKLNPVSFQWRTGEDHHRHYGLIAQQLDAALDGEDFGGLHKPANDHERYGLAYDELIGPLIKSVQQLSAENAELKRRLDLLEHKRSARAR